MSRCPILSRDLTPPLFLSLYVPLYQSVLLFFFHEKEREVIRLLGHPLGRNDLRPDIVGDIDVTYIGLDLKSSVFLFDYSLVGRKSLSDTAKLSFLNFWKNSTDLSAEHPVAQFVITVCPTPGSVISVSI